MPEKQKITKEMLIGDLVQQFPSVVNILLAEGVHCIGCGAAHYESVEQGLKVHGKSDKEIREIVKRLNDAVSEKDGS